MRVNGRSGAAVKGLGCWLAYPASDGAFPLKDLLLLSSRLLLSDLRGKALIWAASTLHHRRVVAHLGLLDMSLDRLIFNHRRIGTERANIFEHLSMMSGTHRGIGLLDRVRRGGLNRHRILVDYLLNIVPSHL
jgi:hypothetical protein